MKLDLNINALQNFVITADMGNITNAAERLYMTQPTLSRQLAGIEDMLGTKLFERRKYGIALTPEGEAFYDQCRKLLKAYGEFESYALSFRHIISGSLTIAYQKASEDMMMFLNSDFLRTYPNVNIENQRQASANFLNLLDRNDLDLAIMYGFEAEQYSHNLRSIRIGELPNVLMVSDQNPLAKRKEVRMEELVNERFILPSKGNSPKRVDQITATCRAAGFMPQVAASAVDIIDFVMDVIRYDGVAVMPKIPSLETNSQIRFIELADYPEKSYPIHLIWNTTNSNPLVQTYLSFVEKYLHNSRFAEES
ncbi:MAG: LysR family transcriptional regulator [Firmicutes bacterium]|nr:LysR family transcriptional regulator [Bacillota bacterium]